MKNENIKTTLKSYLFDTRTAEGKAGYVELCKTLKGQGLKCFETWACGKGHYHPFAKLAKNGLAVELELDTVFDNQWNTAPIIGLSDIGYRVFDWAQDYQVDNGLKHIKRGHYLTQNEAMREVRRNTAKCGYCGKQEPMQKRYAFCPHCTGSAYLTVDLLHRTRMQAVTNDKRAPLTDAELAHLMPIYKEAQLHGQGERGIARMAKARANVERDYKKAIATAEAEHGGFTWLLDHGFNVDNVIYYSHTNRFSFGWQKPVDAVLVSELLDCIGEFPFNYDIKCADGRTLSN